MTDITDQEGPGMAMDEPDHLTWLPRARWGTDDSPRLEIQEDPDDEELAKTPRDVIAMLGFDPLGMDEDASKEISA